MELVVIALVVVCCLAIGGLALWADMSERFSLARQKQDQKMCMSLYRVGLRERKLRGWVIALSVSALLLSVTTAASILGFLAQDAKGYGNANDTILELSFFGMVVCPTLVMAAVYHAVGMTIRLRAWRQVLAESPDASDKGV